MAAKGCIGAVQLRFKASTSFKVVCGFSGRKWKQILCLARRSLAFVECFSPAASLAASAVSLTLTSCQSPRHSTSFKLLSGPHSLLFQPPNVKQINCKIKQIYKVVEGKVTAAEVVGNRCCRQWEIVYPQTRHSLPPAKYFTDSNRQWHFSSEGDWWRKLKTGNLNRNSTIKRCTNGEMKEKGKKEPCWNQQTFHKWQIEELVSCSSNLKVLPRVLMGKLLQKKWQLANVNDCF